jgi:hypothetical protein
MLRLMRVVDKIFIVVFHDFNVSVPVVAECHWIKLRVVVVLGDRRLLKLFSEQHDASAEVLRLKGVRDDHVLLFGLHGFNLLRELGDLHDKLLVLDKRGLELIFQTDHVLLVQGSLVEPMLLFFFELFGVFLFALSRVKTTRQLDLSTRLERRVLTQPVCFVADASVASVP